MAYWEPDVKQIRRVKDGAVFDVIIGDSGYDPPYESYYWVIKPGGRRRIRAWLSTFPAQWERIE